MATKKVNLTLEEQIGFSAGQIYDYLNNNGESTFSKMKKEREKKKKINVAKEVFLLLFD